MSIWIAILISVISSLIQYLINKYTSHVALTDDDKARLRPLLVKIKNLRNVVQQLGMNPDEDNAPEKR